MRRTHRLLYVEHSEIIGGSNVSLKELLIDALSYGYDCHVICASELIAGVYKDLGATTYIAPLAAFSHNTSWSYRLNPLDFLRLARVFVRTWISFIRIYPMVKRIDPDVAHLNSSVLIFYTFYFWLLGIPNIFHVRENIVKGYMGFRRSMIRWIANRFATYVIYISEHELRLLGTNPAKSFVVYNYIHESTFVSAEGAAPPVMIGDKLKLISLGGLFKLKGGMKILQALAHRPSNIKILLVGTRDPREHPDDLALIEGPAYTKEVIEILNNPIVSERVEIVGKVKDPAKYIRQCDALIFWAEAPHFPRTVFEAWILKRPVLYYNPKFSNVIINSNTVLEVKDGDPASLAEAFAALPQSEVFKLVSITNSYELAKENFTEKNFSKIDEIYRLCIREQ